MSEEEYQSERAAVLAQLRKELDCYPPMCELQISEEPQARRRALRADALAEDKTITIRVVAVDHHQDSHVQDNAVAMGTADIDGHAVDAQILRGRVPHGSFGQC